MISFDSIPKQFAEFKIRSTVLIGEIKRFTYPLPFVQDRIFLIEIDVSWQQYKWSLIGNWTKTPPHWFSCCIVLTHWLQTKDQFHRTQHRRSGIHCVINKFSFYKSAGNISRCAM